MKHIDKKWVKQVEKKYLENYTLEKFEKNLIFF